MSGNASGHATAKVECDISIPIQKAFNAGKASVTHDPQVHYSNNTTTHKITIWATCGGKRSSNTVIEYSSGGGGGGNSNETQ
jgi:hypothetical protein